MAVPGFSWRSTANGTVVQADHTTNRKACSFSILSTVTVIFILFSIGCVFIATDNRMSLLGIQGEAYSVLIVNELFVGCPDPQIPLDTCRSRCPPRGSEALPRDIVSRTSDLEMQLLSGSPKRKENSDTPKNLLAIPVGIKQKEGVDQIVQKFLTADFRVILFHYDGVVDEWRDLHWCDNALHVSAINQTKWWFAKRFLHPDIVAEYNYIFLWDEDLGVENFHPGRYLSIVQDEGLEISQPALDTTRGLKVHYPITARQRRNKVHRRFYKLNGGSRCYGNSTGPPCTGWVEMMAPVFTRAAWRCVWHMIQNDLIHAWGLDYKLGYCAQGERSKTIGVVDAEYIVHKGIPTLGGFDLYKVPSGTSSGNEDRINVRLRSAAELEIFKERWRNAVDEDECWTDPYPEKIK
ncbi:unnamed protein product [Spirodela intermedia]|uniref:Uncharacterized protein n=2 Tax=Spirodela intermedia TaxID=51605 RepID=A0A7I8JF72_SPIIN|nr:unnamed protein product [Spirodela intermedia]CAA6668395.1 unnamed protein product [Spirodela intermedia]CAA7405242.1 unnamed protein product [Spirodela intermedia]